MRNIVAFLKDDHASMTVEFVLALPLLLFWYIGSISYYSAYKARTEAAAAAFTIADIASRYDELNQLEMDKLVALQAALLPKVPTSWLRISSIVYDEDKATNGSTHYNLEWSHFSKAGGLDGAVITIFSDIPGAIMPVMVEAEEILLVESFVPFKSFATWAGITPRTFAYKVAVSPRFDSRVAWGL